MADDDFWQHTAARLNDDPSLTKLVSANRPFKEVPKEALAAISRSAKLETIHFSLMRIDDDDCETLRQAGLPGGTLTSLYLSHNLITSNGLNALTAALRDCVALTSLNLSKNPLGAALAPLGRSIARSRVHTLNLTDTQPSGDGLVAMALALCEHDGATPGPLRTLHLQNNGITDAVVAQLVVPLATAGVSELYLGRNRIGDAGAAALAAGCAARASSSGLHQGPHTSPLRTLSLQGNHLGDAAAQAFASALAEQCPLLSLNVSHNQLSDAGLTALVRGVRLNARLDKLDGLQVNSFVSPHHGSQIACTAAQSLQQHMSREALASRRAAQFRRAATVLLLANSYPRMPSGHSSDGDDEHEQQPPYLARLPHAVLISILEHASPPGVVCAALNVT